MIQKHKIFPTLIANYIDVRLLQKKVELVFANPASRMSHSSEEFRILKYLGNVKSWTESHVLSKNCNLSLVRNLVTRTIVSIKYNVQLHGTTLKKQMSDFRKYQTGPIWGASSCSGQPTFFRDSISTLLWLVRPKLWGVAPNLSCKGPPFESSFAPWGSDDQSVRNALDSPRFNGPILKAQFPATLEGNRMNQSEWKCLLKLLFNRRRKACWWTHEIQSVERYFTPQFMVTQKSLSRR